MAVPQDALGRVGAILLTRSTSNPVFFLIAFLRALVVFWFGILIIIFIGCYPLVSL